MQWTLIRASISGHLQSKFYHQYQMSYLIVFSKLWNQYMIYQKQAQPHLLFITYISKKTPGWQNLHITSFFWQLLKLLLLPNALSNFIIKFATYHLHYKKKLVSNSTRAFICTGWLGLLAKKEELSRLILRLLYNAFQLLSLILSSTLSKSTLIFKCVTIPK